jgi:hypothetical protein
MCLFIRWNAMRKLLVIFTALAFAGAALAQQFKWVDKDGKTRYGDVPPPGVTPIRLKGPASGPAPAAKPPAKDGKGASKGPLTSAEKDAEFRKRQLDAEKSREKEQKAEQQAQEKKENCARAKEQLAANESGQRIQRTNAQGERYYLDDSQIAQETAKARQLASQWCGG